MTRSMARGAVVAFAGCALLFATACGDDDDDDDLDAGLDGGKHPTDGGGRDGGGGGKKDAATDSGSSSPSDSGTFKPPPPLMCGGSPCMVSAGAAMLGTVACCTDDDKCGGQSQLFSGCVELGQKGSYDETCPGFSSNTGGFPLSFNGCCTPQGKCGALDSSAGGFGCIPPDVLPEEDGGGMSQSCTYDPSAMCTAIVAVSCDGAEDCPSGQQCCATGFQISSGYAETSCKDSCLKLGAKGDIVSQLCHPGDDCDQPLPTDGGMTGGLGGRMMLPDGGLVPYTCLTSMYLPPFLTRCRDTGTELEKPGSKASGEVNCGDGVCGLGEKCCYVISPQSSAGGSDAGMSAIANGVGHCSPADKPCTCAPNSDADGG